MSHTKEPWIVNGSIRIESEHEHGIVNDGWIIGDLSGQDAKENARRIVACVNACEGIPTDDLEMSPKNGLFNLAEFANKTVIERDQLRELCGELIDAVKNSSTAVYHESVFQSSAFSEDTDWPEWAKKLMDSNHKAITKAERVLGGDNNSLVPIGGEK